MSLSSTKCADPPKLTSRGNMHSLCVITRLVGDTNKIRRLASHLELHKKDFSSERGLRRLLGKRQHLLAYLAKKNRVRYKKLISQLDIRER
uniref:Small ribosomal subunit protein uS15c n=1 Tax=Oryza glaberrima TaxID=4538 RepID=I1PBK8_ORYGL